MNIHINEPSGKFKNQIVDSEYVVQLWSVYSGGSSCCFGELTLMQHFGGQRISPSVGQKSQLYNFLNLCFDGSRACF